MKKVESLRQYLTDAIPGLAKDAERLFLAIDEGLIVPTQRTTTFRIKAKVTVTLLDLPADQIDTLAVALLFWTADNQPELMAAPESATAFPFNVEMLDRKVCDVAFTLALDELVSVSPRPGGGFDLVHRDEPDLEPGWEHLEGWKTDARLLRLFINDDQVLGPPP